jgi:hypothetical protein
LNFEPEEVAARIVNRPLPAFRALNDFVTFRFRSEIVPKFVLSPSRGEESPGEMFLPLPEI